MKVVKQAILTEVAYSNCNTLHRSVSLPVYRNATASTMSTIPADVGTRSDSHTVSIILNTDNRYVDQNVHLNKYPDCAHSHKSGGAMIHFHRFIYAAIACCVLCIICSSMGAEYGIINRSSGIYAAVAISVIVAYHIIKKALYRR